MGRGGERTLRLEHVMATRHPPPTGNFRGSVPFTPHSSYIPWREEETSGGGRRTPLYTCGLCRPLVSLTRQTVDGPALRFRCKLRAPRACARKAARNSWYAAWKGRKYGSSSFNWTLLGVEKTLVKYMRNNRNIGGTSFPEKKNIGSQLIYFYEISFTVTFFVTV